MVLTQRKFQRSFAGLNQQSIPINKSNDHISPVMIKYRVRLELSIMLYLHQWANGVSLFEITSHEFGRKSESIRWLSCDMSWRSLEEFAEWKPLPFRGWRYCCMGSETEKVITWVLSQSLFTGGYDRLASLHTFQATDIISGDTIMSSILLRRLVAASRGHLFHPIAAEHF
jgi:hypothetical protein